MANFFFVVDGPEIGVVGPGEQAVVGNLDFFDTTDIVSGTPGSSLLGFAIAGDIVVNLTGYAGITGFSIVSPQAVGGGINITIGQDFFTANNSGGSMSFLALAATSTVLDASALNAGSSVILQSYGSTNDVLTGGAGNDNLVGGGGADQLNGGAGIDVVRYDQSAAGVTANLAAGGTGSDAQGDTYSSIEGATGSSFNDVLIGAAGTNFLVGLGGDDVLTGGIGADSLDGSDGADTANYSASSAGVTIGLTSTVNFGFGGDAEGDQLAGIENLTGSAFNDILTGGSVVNALDGGDGDDLLNGGAGADVLIGGAGIDTADYIASATGVRVSLAAGIGIGGDAQGDTVTGIENIIGSNGADNLTGAVGVNMLTGNDGADFLDGGAGADLLNGGTGTDTYVADEAGDVVDESGGNAGEIDRVFSSVAVDLSDTSRVLGVVEAVQLVGTGNLNVTGNAVRNYLIGNQGDNVIDGGVGADVMWGRAGNDTYIVDNIGDLIDESMYGANGIDTIISSIGFNLGDTSQARGALENLTLTGSANANAVGNNLANIIVGNDGANIVAGGFGNDQLTGGGANDVFFFNTAPGVGNVDTITDLDESGNDTIWLDDAIFTALTAGPLAAAAFVISSLGAVDADDRIVYDSANGELSYDSDGSGGTAGILFAILDTGLSLTAADFRVV